MFSVIIPTYNRRLYLPRAINSVLAQTDQDFEIIVVDDGSTDGTAELFQTELRDKRIVYHRFSTNRGVNQARNKALDLARGDYVALLDSDDEWFPDALATCREIFEAKADVGFVLAPYVYIDGTLSGLDFDQATYVSFVDLLCENRFRKQKNSLNVFRRSLVGNLRWRVPYLQFVFFRRLASQTRVYFIPKPLGRYHYLAETFSVTELRKRPDRALSIARSEVLVDFLQDFGQQLIDHCPCRYGHHAYGAAVGLLLAGRKREAIRYSFRALRFTPTGRNILFWLFTLLPGSRFLLDGLFWLKGARKNHGS